MRKRDRAGLSMAPVLLRLALGVVFLWAGLAKWFAEIPVSGEQAAVLANAGLISGPSGAPSAPSVPFEEELPADEPVPDESPEEPDDGGQARGKAGEGELLLASYQTASSTYTAADFPSPVTVRMVYGLVLTMHEASHPGFDEATGAQRMAYWPPALGEGPTVVWLARLVAIGEVVCGLGMLVGFMTRLCGFGIATIMLGAMWLTQFGPAIQSGNATLGFLPSHPAWDLEQWATLQTQFTLLCASLAVTLLGAGLLSVDSVLFRPKSESSGDDVGSYDEADD